MIDNRFSNNIIPQPLNIDQHFKQTLNDDYISNNVATSDVNGIDNTKKFYDLIDTNSSLYKYKEYFSDQNKYYIPSIGELGIAFENIQTINNSINSLNGTGQYGFIKLDADDNYRTFLSSTIYDFNRNQNLNTWIYDNRTGKITYASNNSENIVLPFKLFDSDSLDTSVIENYNNIIDINYEYEYPKNDDSYELLSYLFYTNTYSVTGENNANNKYYYQQYVVSLSYYNDMPEPLFSYFLYGDNTWVKGSKVDRSPDNMSYIYDRNELYWHNNKLEYNTNVNHNNFFDIRNPNSYIFPVDHYVKRDSDNKLKIYLNIVPYNFKTQYDEIYISNNSFKFYMILPFEYIFNKLRQVIKKKIEDIANTINTSLDKLLSDYNLTGTTFPLYQPGTGRQTANYQDIKDMVDIYEGTHFPNRLMLYQSVFGLKNSGWNITSQSNYITDYSYYILLFFLLFTKSEINNMKLKMNFIYDKNATYYKKSYVYNYDCGECVREFIRNKYDRVIESGTFETKPFIDSMEKLLYIIGYRYRYSVGTYNGKKFHYYTDLFEYGGSATTDQLYRLYNPTFVDFNVQTTASGEDLILKNLLHIYYIINFNNGRAPKEFRNSIYYYTKDAIIFKIDARNFEYIHNIKNIDFSINFYNCDLTDPIYKGNYGINLVNFYNYNLEFDAPSLSCKHDGTEIHNGQITTSYNTSINPSIYNNYNINYKLYNGLSMTGNEPTACIYIAPKRKNIPAAVYNSFYTKTLINTNNNKQLVWVRTTDNIYEYNTSTDRTIPIYNQLSKNLIGQIIKLPDSKLISLINDTTFSNNLNKITTNDINKIYFHNYVITNNTEHKTYCALRLWNHMTPDGVYDDYVLINDANLTTTSTSGNSFTKSIPSIGYKNMIYYYHYDNREIYDYLLSDYIIIINKTSLAQTIRLIDSSLSSCLSDDDQIYLSLKPNEVKILYPAVHNYNYDLTIDYAGTKKYNYSLKKYRKNSTNQTIIYQEPDNIYIMLKRIISITGNNRNKLTFTGTFLANLDDENIVDKEFKKILNTSFIEKLQVDGESITRVTSTQNNTITIEHCQNPYKGHFIIINNSAE